MLFGIFAMVGAQVLIKKTLSHFGDMEVNVAISVIAASFLVLWVLSPFNTSWNSWTPSHPDQILFWGALLIGALINSELQNSINVGLSTHRKEPLAREVF